MQELNLLHIAALLWFMFLWMGYARFAHRQAKGRRKSLSSEMNRLRKRWMGQLLKREVRMADTSLIANLERNVTFLASTSLLILAGLLTALAATDKLQVLLTDLPFVVPNSSILIHSKIFVLIIIYIYAFFTFSWSMRQYGMVMVVIGAAPMPNEKLTEDEINNFIRVSSKVIDLAAHTYNYGLRAFYFSLSVLAWFISDWLFIFSATLVVVVLYLREFNSRALQEIKNL